MAPSEFLDRPGLPVPFGALMDEYARAAGDFCRVLEGFDASRFQGERASNDPDTRSPRALALHVCGAARRLIRGPLPCLFSSPQSCRLCCTPADAMARGEGSW